MGKETRHITKLLKNTDVKIPYSTNNNLGKLLATRTDQDLDKFERNGVYQLECCHIRVLLHMTEVGILCISGLEIHLPETGVIEICTLPES